MIFALEFGGGGLCHPHRYSEPLAAWRHQVVGRRWPLAPLTNPQGLARQGVQRVINSCVLSICILLTVGTKFFMHLVLLLASTKFFRQCLVAAGRSKCAQLT